MATHRRTRRRNPVDYLFDPMRLVQRAIAGGFIDPGYAESPHAMRVAEEVADAWAAGWPEGAGFGSSDFTYALKDFLDALGVPTHYVGGRLTKKNPRGTSVEGASMSDYNSGHAGWKKVHGAEEFRDAASYFSSGYLDNAGLGRRLGLGPRDMVRVADGDVVGVFYADAGYGIINTKHADYRGGRLVKKNPRRTAGRRNSMGADAMFYALQSKRIPWSQFSTDQLRAVMAEAASYGDSKLAERAKAALARRSR